MTATLKTYTPFPWQIPGLLDGSVTMLWVPVKPQPRQVMFQIYHADQHLWFNENRDYPRRGNLFSMTWKTFAPGDRIHVESPSLYLEVLEVKCARVQSITEAEAVASGMLGLPEGPIPEYVDKYGEDQDGEEVYPGETSVARMSCQWDRDHPKFPWSSNPVAWGVRVKRVEKE